MDQTEKSPLKILQIDHGQRGTEKEEQLKEALKIWHFQNRHHFFDHFLEHEFLQVNKNARSMSFEKIFHN